MNDRPSVKEMIDETVTYIGMERHCEGLKSLPDPVVFVMAVASVARELAASVVCKVRGHKFEDRSQAGPDAGSIDMVCTRCGESHYARLY